MDPKSYGVEATETLAQHVLWLTAGKDRRCPDEDHTAYERGGMRA